MYGINNEPAVLLLERDYRLLLSVARAAEKFHDVSRAAQEDEVMHEVLNAVDALNARPKERT